MELLSQSEPQNPVSTTRQSPSRPALALAFAGALAAASALPSTAEACPPDPAPCTPAAPTTTPTYAPSYTLIYIDQRPTENKSKTPANYWEFDTSVLATWTPNRELGIAGALGLKYNVPVNKWATVSIGLEGKYGLTPNVTPAAPNGFTVDQPVAQRDWGITPTIGLRVGKKVFFGTSAGLEIGGTTTDEANITKLDKPSTREVETATGTIDPKTVNGDVNFVVGGEFGVNITDKAKLALTGQYYFVGPKNGAANLGPSFGYKF